jgi:2-polyprenyl-3-methyl-5-hydroxy-6-metoxy-1,4-benzoquinol methylase
MAATARGVMEFEQFLAREPLYAQAFARLQASPALALSARAVFNSLGEELSPIASDILGFVDRMFPPGYMEQYVRRTVALGEMQRRFNRNPCLATLGDPDAKISREAYVLSLLLSIVFTRHRFAIFRAMDEFLLTRAPSGRIAIIGSGPGYEVRTTLMRLPDWAIDAYDTDAEMHRYAREMIGGDAGRVTFRGEFPGDALTRYDAVACCEMLEHLRKPEKLLQDVRSRLEPKGELFVTMAVNIAQEDHVFLYPDAESCRRQLEECGFAIRREWTASQALFPTPVFRGNYIAVAG